MTKTQLPSDTAPTSEWVTYGESRAGDEFSQDLGGYFTLARELIDKAGPLVERIAEQSGEGRSIHAAALILARVASEMAACVHLLRRGYAAQAITLVGTMLELAHVLAYIGNDEERAANWAAWNEPTRAYPGSIKNTIREAASAFGIEEADIIREYEGVYRQICLIKHGNTLALPIPNSATIGDLHCVVIGPLVGADFIRLGHAAAQWAVRYAILAETAFVHYHIPSEQRTLYSEHLKRHASRLAELVVGSREKLAKRTEETQSAART